MANTQLLEKLSPLVKKLPAVYFSDACKWQASEGIFVTTTHSLWVWRAVA